MNGEPPATSTLRDAVNVLTWLANEVPYQSMRSDVLATRRMLLDKIDIRESEWNTRRVREGEFKPRRGKL